MRRQGQARNGIGIMVMAWFALASCAKGNPDYNQCGDYEKNLGESDVDCGGDCKPCANDKACKRGADCESGVCFHVPADCPISDGGIPLVCAFKQVCVPMATTCSNGKKDGHETDVDCGGDCKPCANDKACKRGADCESGVCTSDKCAAKMDGGQPSDLKPTTDLSTPILQNLAFNRAEVAGIGKDLRHVLAGDFNGDKKLDLVTVHGNGEVRIHLGNGTGGFQANASTYPVGNGAFVGSLGDLNNDGKLDIVTADSGSGTVSVLLGKGDGTFMSSTSYSAGQFPQGIAVGDLNGDGKLDVVVANAVSVGTVTLLLGDGTGKLSATGTLSVGDTPDAVAVGDLNNDGKLDIVAGNNRSGTISVLIGKGAGTFAPKVDYPTTGTGTQFVLVVDLNGDGKIDVVTTNDRSNDVSTFTNQGSGTFGAAASSPVGQGPRFFATGDLNNDGKPDIIVPSLDAKVSLIMNGLPGASLTAAGPNTDSAAVGDFNGDGKLDIVAGNQGPLGGPSSLTVFLSIVFG